MERPASGIVMRLMAGTGPHAAELAADVADFTNLTQVQQISAVFLDSCLPS
jgi:hypothetical protein